MRSSANQEQQVREELLTSLPLQMAVYFNLFYSPLWLISRCLALYIKLRYLSLTQQTISAAILIMMTAVEPPRLYLGYAGNLGEEVVVAFGVIRRVTRSQARRFLRQAATSSVDALEQHLD
ncbi:hypothetical protein MRX96_004405 [Rhipicephalus microplus]